MAEQQVHDLLGVGFGPASLSVAIAMTEAGQAGSCAFIEAYDRFAWHPGMMVSVHVDRPLNPAGRWSKGKPPIARPELTLQMQISFVKDLATMRNPASTYSFLKCVAPRRSR